MGDQLHCQCSYCPLLDGGDETSRRHEWGLTLRDIKYKVALFRIMNGERGWSGWASSPDVRAHQRRRPRGFFGTPEPSFIRPSVCRRYSLLHFPSLRSVVKTIFHQVPLLPKRGVSPRVFIPILIIMLFCGADVKKGKVGVFAEFH